MHYFILDTNIYRELGVAFKDNIDFGYFQKFVERSPHELLMLDIVHKEFSDFFKKDYIYTLIKEYEKLYMKFERNPYLENIPLADLTIIEKKAKEKFEEDINESCWKIIKGVNVDSSILADFLIYNKRKSNKDDTRDYLILLNVLEIAKKYRKDKVIFITRDKIFKENEFFKKMIRDSGVQNLEQVESIASYLSDYSAKLSFVDDDNILKSISAASIEKELIKDITSFPSYISSFYYGNNVEAPDWESIKILDIKLKEYYTFSEDKVKTVIVTTLIVRVKIIYEAELSVQLKEYPKVIHEEDNLNRVDNFNRPIYENNVLFIFKGTIDKVKQKISKQKFVDFIPDWNVPEL